MSEKRHIIGFGFQPDDSLHHFLVVIPEKKDGSVVIYERFEWQENVPVQQLQVYDNGAKAEISKHKWKQIEEPLRVEFNNRLKKKQLPAGRFVLGQNPVERLLGKEMLVLIWSIEDCDPSVIPTAVRNWLGLAPEERWWLFTMTNAATGNLGDRQGWRKALRYALTENPIDDQRQKSLFDVILNKGEEE